MAGRRDRAAVGSGTTNVLFTMAASALLAVKPSGRLNTGRSVANVSVLSKSEVAEDENASLFDACTAANALSCSAIENGVFTGALNVGLAMTSSPSKPISEPVADVGCWTPKLVWSDCEPPPMLLSLPKKTSWTVVAATAPTEGVESLPSR